MSERVNKNRKTQKKRTCLMQSCSNLFVLKLSKPKMSSRDIVPYLVVGEVLGCVTSLHFATSKSNTRAYIWDVPQEQQENQQVSEHVLSWKGR